MPDKEADYTHQRIRKQTKVKLQKLAKKDRRTAPLYLDHLIEQEWSRHPDLQEETTNA